jgi:hypothetical protein
MNLERADYQKAKYIITVMKEKHWNHSWLNAIVIGH